MWNGKKKAVTFSFDDGVLQDIRLIEILNKYGLKATFNLNSGLASQSQRWNYNGVDVVHIDAEDIPAVYKNHEVAVHTLTHPNLTQLDEQEIIRQVEEDRMNLSRMVGYEVVGMAYPCGGVNNDERVAKIIREKTGVQYARTITSTYNFMLQKNLLRFNPSVYYTEKRLDEIIDSFLTVERSEPQLLYIWGHSYEMDAGDITWEHFEEICNRISNQEEIFYGTNKEILLKNNIKR